MINLATTNPGHETRNPGQSIGSGLYALSHLSGPETIALLFTLCSNPFALSLIQSFDYIRI